ncbi:MAG: DUF481 domain-containing protein [Chitinophagales bacterium]|nr:DUF481 domain-containing protein [Chitinophagales bacterium]
MSLKVCLSIFVLITTFNLSAQITNVESQRRKTDTTGWYGESNIGFKLLKEVNRVFGLNADVRIQYKQTKNLYLLLGDYHWSQSGGNVFVHNAYIHFRYNRSMKPKWLKWEFFTQAQFNKMTKVNLRLLNGSGFRFKASGGKKAVLYVGTGYMYEWTKELDVEKLTVNKSEHRMSSYISTSIFPNDVVSIISTSYYQPRIDRWSDYRFSSINELKVKLSRMFTLGTVFNISYDKSPVLGIPRLNYSIENKLGIVF